MMIEQALNGLKADVAEFLNILVRLPSDISPHLSPRIVMILISLLFGYLYGKNAMDGLKMFSMALLSFMFYGTLRFIGVG